MAKNLSFLVGLNLGDGNSALFEAKQLISASKMSLGLPDMEDEDANGLVWRLFQEITSFKRASILAPSRVPQVAAALGDAILRPGKLEVHIELIHRSGFVVPAAIVLTGATVTAVDTRGRSAWVDLVAEEVHSDRSSYYASSSALGKDPDDGSQ